jgi:hypothetical protein
MGRRSNRATCDKYLKIQGHLDRYESAWKQEFTKCNHVFREC